ETHNNLGLVLNDLDQIDKAIAAFRRALELRPDYAEAHNNLGTAFKCQGRLDEAIAAYRQSVECNGDFSAAHCNLGVVYKEQGNPQAAISAFRRALELDPRRAAMLSNIIYTLLYLRDAELRQTTIERKAWNQSFGRPAGNPAPSHLNDRDPERRL